MKLFYEIDMKRNIVIEKPIANYFLFVLGAGSLITCVFNYFYSALFLLVLYLVLILYKTYYFRKICKKSRKLTGVSGSKYSLNDSKRYQFKELRLYE